MEAIRALRRLLVKLKSTAGKLRVGKLDKGEPSYVLVENSATVAYGPMEEEVADEHGSGKGYFQKKTPKFTHSVGQSKSEVKPIFKGTRMGFTSNEINRNNCGFGQSIIRGSLYLKGI